MNEYYTNAFEHIVLEITKNMVMQNAGNDTESILETWFTLIIKDAVLLISQDCISLTDTKTEENNFNKLVICKEEVYYPSDTNDVNICIDYIKSRNKVIIDFAMNVINSELMEKNIVSEFKLQFCSFKYNHKLCSSESTNIRNLIFKTLAQTFGNENVLKFLLKKRLWYICKSRKIDEEKITVKKKKMLPKTYHLSMVSKIENLIQSL